MGGVPLKKRRVADDRDGCDANYKSKNKADVDASFIKDIDHNGDNDSTFLSSPGHTQEDSVATPRSPLNTQPALALTTRNANERSPIVKGQTPITSISPTDIPAKVAGPPATKEDPRTSLKRGREFHLTKLVGFPPDAVKRKETTNVRKVKANAAKASTKKAKEEKNTKAAKKKVQTPNKRSRALTKELSAVEQERDILNSSTRKASTNDFLSESSDEEELPSFGFRIPRTIPNEKAPGRADPATTIVALKSASESPKTLTDSIYTAVSRPVDAHLKPTESNMRVNPATCAFQYEQQSHTTSTKNNFAMQTRNYASSYINLGQRNATAKSDLGFSKLASRDPAVTQRMDHVAKKCPKMNAQIGKTIGKGESNASHVKTSISTPKRPHVNADERSQMKGHGNNLTTNQCPKSRTGKGNDVAQPRQQDKGFDGHAISTQDRPDRDQKLRLVANRGKPKLDASNSPCPEDILAKSAKSASPASQAKRKALVEAPFHDSKALRQAPFVAKCKANPGWEPKNVCKYSTPENRGMAEFVVKNAASAGKAIAKQGLAKADAAAKKSKPKKKRYDQQILRHMVTAMKPFSRRCLAQELNTTEQQLYHPLLAMKDKKLVFAKEFANVKGSSKTLIWANLEVNEAVEVYTDYTTEKASAATEEVQLLIKQERILQRESAEVTSFPWSKVLSAQIEGLEMIAAQFRQQKEARKQRINSAKAQSEEIKKFTSSLHIFQPQTKSTVVLARERFHCRMKLRINAMLSEWKNRKDKCQESIDTISDAMEKKTKEVVNMLDLETDEMIGIVMPAKYHVQKENLSK